MLLFLCLVVGPCVCVTHFAFHGLLIYIHVWHYFYVYCYVSGCCHVWMRRTIFLWLLSYWLVTFTYS